MSERVALAASLNYQSKPVICHPLSRMEQLSSVVRNIVSELLQGPFRVCAHH
jgi:hypothetical protein